MIAQRGVARCVHEGPRLVYLLMEVGKRWSRFGRRLVEEAAQCWMTGESYPQAIQVVALRLLFWLGFLDWCSIQPKFAYGHVEGIGESLQD